MKRLTLILAAIAALCISTGCTTISGTGDKAPNWELINTTSKTALKWSTKLVLDKNPSYSEQVAAINGGVAAIFSGVPTQDGVTAQILALAPKLSPQEAKTYAAAVMDAYAAYVAATGKTVLVQTDEHVSALIAAITTGIAEGVALHKATN